ncbi:hypothetical protein NDU88_001471 [Pleurodeles waltl]|uniref:Uncharacterized protein n=1 Tax=Pleurodeles waltl TaxID=8319 RepID=A0AAV7R979_PLEWA|nr:hypothetical protein NDU88_001471 [Pleurodeles waltl]
MTDLALLGQIRAKLEEYNELVQDEMAHLGSAAVYAGIALGMVQLVSLGRDHAAVEVLHDLGVQHMGDFYEDKLLRDWERVQAQAVDPTLLE